jgi:hypothetical protein
MCPRTPQSGARERPGRTGKGNPYLKGVLGPYLKGVLGPYLKGVVGDGTSGPLTSATGTEPGAASRYIRNVSGGPGR